MTSSIDRASDVNDFRALAALRREARAESPEALREAARQFESLFTRMLVESMRSASFGDPLFGGDQADFYQGMFDDQLAVELSKGRGLGLADMLIQQLTRAGLARDITPPGVDASTIDVRKAEAPATEALTTNNSFAPRSRDEFVREVWPHAEAAARQLGVDPRAVVAHAALETGWGKSLPADRDGRTSFNLFGIKATRGWRGAVAGSSTIEFEGGLPARRVERFRAYDSIGASFRDYANLLQTSSRYAAVRNVGSDITAFASGLQRAGYATDPDYANKLTAVAAQLGLESRAAAMPGARGLKEDVSRPLAKLAGTVRSEG